VNRTDRLYALVEELRAVAPRPRSARWLSERFEVSSRTIERDLSALQQAGVPIYAEPGRTGGYCIDAALTLPPLGLTVDEALAVSIGLGMLDGSPFRRAAASALRKMAAVTGEVEAGRTTELAARVFLLDDEDAPAEAPTLLADALRESVVLRLVYRAREGAETVRDVEPVGFVGRGRQWYLVGWCRLRDGLRPFRGDRIVSAVPTGERVARRDLTTADIAIVYGRLRAGSRGD